MYAFHNSITRVHSKKRFANLKVGQPVVSLINKYAINR
jgi:hypothetical protein